MQEIHDGLDFSVDDNNDEFGIFSVKYSNDGRELVAASSNNSIYVYDLEAKRLSLQIPAHMVWHIIIRIRQWSLNLLKL